MKLMIVITKVKQTIGYLMFNKMYYVPLSVMLDILKVWKS